MVIGVAAVGSAAADENEVEVENVRPMPRSSGQTLSLYAPAYGGLGRLLVAALTARVLLALTVRAWAFDLSALGLPTRGSSLLGDVSGFLTNQLEDTFWRRYNENEADSIGREQNISNGG